MPQAAARKTFGMKGVAAATPARAGMPAAPAEAGHTLRRRNAASINPTMVVAGFLALIVGVGAMSLATAPPAPQQSGPVIIELPKRAAAATTAAQNAQQPQAAPSGGKFGAVNDGFSRISR
jgi:hypothetical protein